MVDTKEALLTNIKEWITLDKEMKLLRSEIKNRRDRKKVLTETLVETMKTNEIDCFNINDGKLIYSQNKIRAPLSKKHLIACLTKFYENEPNNDARDKLAEYILDSRDVKIKDNIRLKGNKK